MNDYIYVGQELELFLGARNWKSYWLEILRPYIRGNVADVGAGIGGTLIAGQEVLTFDTWTAIEPDRELYSVLCQNIEAIQNQSENFINAVHGTINDIDAQFDTILYIDVIEHIENDYAELIDAASKLKDHGRVITVTPAHNYLFSEFDRHVGHFRRYDEKMLRSLESNSLKLDRVVYLDSVGMLLSAANRLILKSALPTKAQIEFWDRTIVPISKVIDRIIRYRLGKTIVGIWSKP